MKPRIISPSRLSFPLAAALAALLSLTFASAATYYWDTNGASTASASATGTWVAGSATIWSTDPTGASATAAETIDNTSDLVFAAGTYATGGTVTISTTQSAHSLTFDDGVGFTLSSGTAINLGSSVAGSGVFMASTAGSATISTPLILNSAATDIAFSSSATQLLTVGAVTGAAASGTRTITVGASSTGGITLGGIIGNGGAGGNVALSINSSGAGITTLSAANTYTGGTTITAGPVRIGSTTALGAAASAVSVASGAALDMNGIGMANQNALTLNGSGIGGTGALLNSSTSANGTYAGVVTLGSNSTIGNTTSGRVMTITNGTISTVNTGGFTLTFKGAGTINIPRGTGISGSGSVVVDGVYLDLRTGGAQSTNNYTGTTTVQNGGGILYFSNNIGTGNINLNGGVLEGYFNEGLTRPYGTASGQFQITGGVSGFGVNGNNTINFSNVTEVKWGDATFSPSKFVLGNTGTNTFAEGIDLNGSDRIVTTNVGGVLSGVIRTTTGTAGLIKEGAGTLSPTVTNTYNGPTTITAGTLIANTTASLGNSSSTNTLIFNGGTLQASVAFNSAATRGVTMTGTGIINTNSFAVGILGDITGAGGLTKNGTNTLTLSGTNNYGGVTTVATGTLAISKEASLASNTATNLNVKSGATLAVNVDSAGTAGFTSSNLSTLLSNISVANSAAQGLQAGAMLAIDTSTASGATFTLSSAITNSTGAFGGAISLTKLGAGTLVIDQSNTYTGATTISAGTLQLNAGGVIATPIGNNATFAINSAGAVTQGTNFGLISGTGAVTNAGAGTLTLNLANTYSGLTTVSAGTIALSNALAIQNSALVTTSGTTTYSGGAALTLGGLSGATGDLGSSSVLSGYTGLVTALTLNPQTGVSVTYGGIISNGSGTMSLTKTGAGTQTLTGANTYTGATIINAGTLAIGAGGSLSSSSALQISGGTFSYGNTGASLTLTDLAFGAGNSGVSNTATGQTLTLGAINRTAGIFGTVNFATLTGSISTTTGNVNGIIGPWATTGSGTSLRYAVGSPDGSTPTNISAFTSGTPATANTLANVTDATVNYEYAAAVAAMPASTALTGNTLRYSGGATTTAINATSSLTLNGLMNAGSAGPLTISGGPTTGGILIGSTGELVIAANAQATTISAAIGGAGRLIYSGAGSTLSLSSLTNAYTGGTVINSGTVTLTGTTNTDVNAVLGNTSGGITLNGGQLRLAGVNVSAARIFTVNGVGSSLFVNKNNNFTTTGKLSGDGSLATLDGGGSGTLSTYSFNSTANDYTGRLSGTNTIINVNSFGNSANSIVLDGSTFNYGTGATGATSLANRVIELSGTTGGATISNANTTAARTLSIGGGLLVTGVGSKSLTLGGVNTGDNAFSGSINDGPGSQISLTKAGAGTWVLGGSNAFTGATTVSAGRLSLNNLNALANSSVTVASTGTLGFPIAGTYNIPGTINIAGAGLALPGGAGALWFGQGGSYSSTLNNPINMTAAATIGSFGNVMTQTLGGAISGTGPLTIQSQGGTTTDKATWNLNAASSYSGNTIFTTSGGVYDSTIKLGVNNALPITTSLNLQSSNSQAVNTFTTFDLNGKNQELAGLTDTGGTPPAANTVGKRVINSSGSLSTLTINNAGAVTYGTTGTRILAGTIGGLDAAAAAANNLALTKTGVGTLTLTGLNTFTGDVTISNGTLSPNLAQSALANPTSSPLGNPQTVGRLITIASLGTLNFINTDTMGNAGTTVVAKLVANGGTIRNTGSVFNTIGPVDLNGGTLSSFGGNSVNFPSFYLNGTVTVGGSAVSTISSTGTNSQIALRNAGTTFDVADAVVGSGSDLNVTGVLGNFNGATGTLIKSGAGTMTLSGANTYTGTTAINGGTLALGANNVLPATAVSIGAATLDASTFTDTVGTLDATGAAVINLGTGGALAFVDSSAVDWTGGSINITGTLGATSIRFGTTSGGLTSGQLAVISVNGSGAGTYTLDAGGYLVSGGPDMTPPTLTSIADNVSGGPVDIGATVTYTVTFNEDIDASTVSAADFSNAGTATASIGTITETTPGVFTVLVTPSTSGTLRLQIPTTAVLTDVAGNPLDNDPALLDDTTITVRTIYDTWANATYVPPLTMKLAGDDQDGDTFNNLMEFAFGTHPTVSSSGSIVWVDGGAVTTPGQPVAINMANPGVDYRAVFGRRKDYAAAGLTYTVEFSAGLNVWVPSAVTPTVLTGAGGLNASEIEAVSVPYPLLIDVGGNNFKKPTFFRLTISN